MNVLNQLGLTNSINENKYPIYGEVKTNATSFLMGVTYKFNKYRLD